MSIIGKPYVTRRLRPMARRRILMGLRQTDVEQALGVCHASYNAWETGRKKPNAVNLLALAKFYGCDPAELLERSEAK